jgi:acetolactate synthase-1/2/3 large subunit
MDPRNIGINMPVYRGIVADAKSTLKMLVACLKEMGVKPSDGARVRQYQEIVKQWYDGTLQPVIDSFSDDKIHPAQSVLAARQVFPTEAINVADGGNTSLFNAFFTEFTKPRTSLGLFEFGHLGTGIPSAIGAKLANPEKEVYCITGDGAAGFNFMEMETALREEAKITVIVHAEGSWCMEEIGHIMEGADPSRYKGVVQSPIRWDKTAESMGCHGEYVEKAEELPEAITRARDSELPAVVCVKTDRQSNLFAPGLALFAEVYTGPIEE